MSLYDLTIPTLIQYINNLSTILEKAVAHAEAKGIKPDDMAEWRLTDDMLPLSFQIQVISNTAKFIAVRVAGISNVVMEDNEKTISELQTRLARTIEVLNTVDKAAMDAGADKEVVMDTPRGKFSFENGTKYTATYALPNFFFHVTTAYGILRARGVEIGKMDYIRGALNKVEE